MLRKFFPVFILLWAWPPTIISLSLPVHPRLRVDADGLVKIQNAIASDATAKAFFEALVLHGESLLKSPLINCTRTGVESSLLAQARAVLDRTYSLGLLYRLNNDSRFSTRAIREMVHVSVNCTNWNPSHFLDVAEMTHAVAIGYDWLFDIITPTDKHTIEQSVIKFGLQAGADAYNNKAWWSQNPNNWNLVCNGGLAIGALGFEEIAPHLANTVLNNATTGIPFAMASYHPDGAWAEGETYWGYATKYALAVIDVMNTALGTDHGWSKSSGFNKTGLFRILGTGPTGKTLHFGDSGSVSNDEFVPNFFGLAHHSNELKAAYAYTGRAIMGTKPKCAFANCALALISYSSFGSIQDIKALPLVGQFHSYVSGWNGFSFVGIMRSGWNDKNASWIGFRASNGEANHNDLDGGTFVFTMGGQRWAIDLGSDSYGLPGYWSKGSAHGKRYSYYRKSTHGHNTLVFGGNDDNPGPSNQAVKAVANITILNASKDIRTPFTLVDLTSLYKKQGINRCIRGISFLQNYKQLLVVDEFSNADVPNVTWAMHTEAKVTQSESNTITLAQGGVNLKIEVLEPVVNPPPFKWRAVRLAPPQKSYSTP